MTVHKEETATDVEAIQVIETRKKKKKMKGVKKTIFRNTK